MPASITGMRTCLSVTAPGNRGWYDYWTYYGQELDLTTGIYDSVFRGYTLQMLKMIMRQCVLPCAPPWQKTEQISGSGWFVYTTPISLVALTLQGSAPPSVARMFGAPNIYRLGEFAWAYPGPDDNHPFMGELKFINFERQAFAEPLATSACGWYYNLAPGVSMSADIFGLPEQADLTSIFDDGHKQGSFLLANGYAPYVTY
jgi:hypothetical protein